MQNDSLDASGVVLLQAVLSKSVIAEEACLKLNELIERRRPHTWLLEISE